MEDFFDIPLILKDYKDLIPEDYNDKEYYEGKPVEGVIFYKEVYRDTWSDESTFEILCYRIPHRGNRDTMCHLKTFEPIKLPGRSIPISGHGHNCYKSKQEEQLAQFLIDNHIFF